MNKILFLGLPGYGHINPTLGIIAELVKQGKEVVYYCTEEFKERIESVGAVFQSYCEWEGLGDIKPSKEKDTNIKAYKRFLEDIINSCEKNVENILEQTKDMEFDAIGYSANLPYGSIIAQILKIPSFSSFEVFAAINEVVPEELSEDLNEPCSLVNKYKALSQKLKVKYNVEMPALESIFTNKGDINFAYTSECFVSNGLKDDFTFIGPPIYDRKEDTTDFPFKEIDGKKVIYISLGTVYSNFDKNLYDIFFKAFKDTDVIVVMTAFNTDLSDFDIPKNFVVRNYISQSEILKYADAAITHSGMNSTNDLIFNNVPFVAIPLGADQPYMSSKSASLGACISLDIDTLTPEILRNSVKKVATEPQYKKNIMKINKSFKECGGYKKAAKEILSLKKAN